jgi:hydrogenase maturation protease
MHTQAIICIGNRLIERDALGGRVFDALADLPALPADTDLIDGGLKGLDLLGYVDGRCRVIFVDALDEASFEPGVRVLTREAVAAFSTSYGHDAGLPYLLSLLPKLCQQSLPEILLVGAAGPATPTTVEKIVECCLEIAGHGRN